MFFVAIINTNDFDEEMLVLTAIVKAEEKAKAKQKQKIRVLKVNTGIFSFSD